MTCSAIVYLGISICSIITFAIVMGIQLNGCTFPIEIITMVWIQFALTIIASILHCCCFTTVVDCFITLLEQCFMCLCNIKTISRFLHLSFLLPFSIFIVSIITDYTFYINQDFSCELYGISTFTQAINSLYISQGVILAFSFIGFTTGLPGNKYEKVETKYSNTDNRYM